MMKKINIKIYAWTLLTLFAASSCEDYLDINENPNAPTTAGIDLILPEAIVASGSVSNAYNSYGGHFGGFIANAGGFSGFGQLLSYRLTPADWNGLWTTTYQDALMDLKTVLDATSGYQTAGDGIDQYMVYNAAARIMTVVNYQRVVDAFGDAAYSQALQGLDNLAPAYDQAEDIYTDLYAQLDEAIGALEIARDNYDRIVPLNKATDPLFSEGFTTTGTTAPNEAQTIANIDKWIAYANTLKLRILVRVKGVPGFETLVTTGFASFDPASIIQDDVIINPGYETNRPNPTYNSWGRTTTNTLSNSSRIPTTYAFSFYNGAKLDDEVRGAVVFPGFPGTTPHNQLGNEDGAPQQLANTPSWGSGILKGAAMGQPMMLRAEALFLLAEAQLNGDIATGDYVTSFEAGIQASANYLYKNAAETVTGLPATFLADYIAANSGNYLVDIDAAGSDEEALEAIITQKWIALNMINSDEAFNEFRRTGYPATTPGGGAVDDIASNKSTSTHTVDNLITRVMYPSSEQSYNATNYITIDPFSETNAIFWDIN